MGKLLLGVGLALLLSVVGAWAGFGALMSRISTSTIDADPAEVADALADQFRIAVPPGYKGAFALEFGFFGIRAASFVALVPQDADPASIFEGGRSIKFNPGEHTIMLAVRSYETQSEAEAQRDLQRLVLGDDAGGSPMVPVFIEAADRRVAAYEGRSAVYGQHTLSYFFFIGDGRLIYLSGPADGFDHAFRDALAGQLASAYPANERLYAHVEKLQRDPAHPCGLGVLPERIEIQAVGVRRGDRELVGMALDPANDRAGEQTVAVGRTELPVVLVLMSGEPTVWRVLSSPDAQIAGVLASGDGRQRVIGLDPGIPLQELDPRDRNACRPFYAHEPEGYQYEGVDDRVFEIFAQGISRMHTVHGGAYFRIGELAGEPTPKNDLRVEDVVLDPSEVLLPGRLGLAQLLERGALEPARPSDLGTWMPKLQRERSFDPEAYRKRLALDFRLQKVFIVNDQIELPAGMFGANAAVFLVRSDVPDPRGERSHNTLIYGDGRCVGTCP